jgi:hypothetical protein
MNTVIQLQHVTYDIVTTSVLCTLYYGITAQLHE